MVNESEIVLAEAVRKYKALYDKTCKDYHRKDVQKNCWDAVAKEIELESGRMIYTFMFVF